MTSSAPSPASSAAASTSPTGAEVEAHLAYRAISRPPSPAGPLASRPASFGGAGRGGDPAHLRRACGSTTPWSWPWSPRSSTSPWPPPRRRTSTRNLPLGTTPVLAVAHNQPLRLCDYRTPSREPRSSPGLGARSASQCRRDGKRSYGFLIALADEDRLFGREPWISCSSATSCQHRAPARACRGRPRGRRPEPTAVAENGGCRPARRRRGTISTTCSPPSGATPTSCTTTWPR